jgi:hypothetical protein
MTPFAFLVPNDVYFIALHHGIAMSAANLQANPIIGLVNIAGGIMNGNPALLEFSDILIGKSTILFAPVSHRTYEIDVHDTPFLALFNHA